MQVNQAEYSRMVGDFIQGRLVLALPSDWENYPHAEQRLAAQHVESMREITDAGVQYGVQFQRVDGQTIDVVWDWA